MRADLVFESKFWIISLGTNQAYLGRSYVTLKRPCGDLAELKKAELLDFIDVVKKLESSLRKSFDATMFNWACLMNLAYQNTPANPQVHWHFMPRYNHKVKFAGQVFEDPDFSHHYDKDRENNVSEKVKSEIIKKIKENLVVKK